MGGAGCFDGSEYPGVSSKLANESAAPPPGVLLLVVEGKLDDVLMVDCVCCGIKHVNSTWGEGCTVQGKYIHRMERIFTRHLFPCSLALVV